MKIMKKTLCVCGIAAVMLCHAAEFEVDGLVEAKVNSAYLWRGALLNEEPVFQPSLRLDVNEAMGILIWGSWDLTEQEGTWDRNRVDVSASYTKELAKCVLKAGAVSYIYHDTTFSTQKDTYEVFLKASCDVFALPTLTLYYDFGKHESFFSVFSLAGSKELIKDKAEIEWRLSAEGADEKYNDAFFFEPANSVTNIFSMSGWKMIDASLVVQVPVSIKNGWTFIPGVTYYTIIDEDIKDALEILDMKKEKFIFSAALEYSF